MNRLILIIFIVLFSLVLTGAFVYFGKKIRLMLNIKVSYIPRTVFWSVYALCMFLAIYFRTPFFATFVYGLILFIITDMITMICRKFKIHGKLRKILKRINKKGVTALFIAIIITVAASLNSRHFVITSYHVEINKAVKGNEINIVMISDTHLGTSVKKNELDKIVSMINGIEADAVCLCGDIIDERTSPELIDYAVYKFSQIQSPVYYINGNHETEAMREEFGKKLVAEGIKVLYDDWDLVDNRFYIAGRNCGGIIGDKSDRISAEELLNITHGKRKINKSLPIIMLDHTPNSSEENKAAHIDLQLSGHTHNGQLYPFNYISALTNDYGYGLYNADDYNIIVSSGVGTWGFPVRFGSKSEIVSIKITGTK